VSDATSLSPGVVAVEQECHDLESTSFNDTALLDPLFDNVRIGEVSLGGLDHVRRSNETVPIVSLCTIDGPTKNLVSLLLELGPEFDVHVLFFDLPNELVHMELALQFAA
jgi:hypothetical protein